VNTSITKLRIKELCITTSSITALSIMTYKIMTSGITVKIFKMHDSTQNNSKSVTTVSIIALRVAIENATLRIWALSIMILVLCLYTDWHSC
jgi:hypothetical protein